MLVYMIYAKWEWERVKRKPNPTRNVEGLENATNLDLFPATEV
jgi:hypothetical protein